MHFDFSSLLQQKFTLSGRLEDLDAKLLCQNIFYQIDLGSHAIEQNTCLQVMYSWIYSYLRRWAKVIEAGCITRGQICKS